MTQPDRPPEQPEAEIYPQLPSPEEVNLSVRVTSSMAPPGARRVPVDIYVTADVEYTGVLIPLDFDERYLRLSAAEVHVVSGVALQDNNDANRGAGPEEGNAVVFSGLGVNSRRLAEVGEALNIATLYFDVLESAEGDVETALSVVPVTNNGGLHEPFIYVRHLSEIGEDGTWTRVEPLVIQNGALAIRREITEFLRGDANGDLGVNITDPITTLNFLFLGGPRPYCLDAADANDDGELNVTDPVRTLGFLFKGGEPLPPPLAAPGEDPTPDSLGCLYRSEG